MFIVLEGLDRTGKSTVADHYRKQGFEVIHLSAPNKKYTSPGYVGPSYLDEMIDMLMKYDGKNVVWDRSWYGESVWPAVYGRESQLTEDDIDAIKDFEERNAVHRILMIDTNPEAHWKRCVDNKEPLDRRQFENARQLFSQMAHQHNFAITTLPQFLEQNGTLAKTDSTPALAADPAHRHVDPVALATVPPVMDEEIKMTPEQEKLEKANAINSILKMKKIFKQQGWPFDDLETQVRSFLNTQLGSLLGSSQDGSISKEEILIVKEFVKRLKEKQGVKA